MKRLFLGLGVIILLSAIGYGQGLTPVPRLQFFTNAGVPCASCTLTTYAAGTSNLLATYSDAALSTANPTTITLNSAGVPSVSGTEVGIYLAASSYKFVLKDSTGATIRTMDNIASGMDPQLRWYVSSGHLKAATDNTYDIGASGATRPRTIYSGTSVVTPKAFITTTQSPASGAACTAGEITWDASYIYVCTASGAFKRAALTGGY